MSLSHAPTTMTLTRHIIETQRDFPYATGEFTDLLNHIALAGKIISSYVNKAGLTTLLGMTGDSNVQGEKVRKLDEWANSVMIHILSGSQRVCVMASEEDVDAIPVEGDREVGKYAVCFDPLDGSSNIDANVSIGTIFSIYHRKQGERPGSINHLLRPGAEQVAAGYILYGSSSIFVYTAGDGVNGFTLDPSIGEFLLSHRDIRVKPRGRIFSINAQNRHYWPDHTRRFVDWVTCIDEETKRPYSSRYIGSLVADFHRNLLYGGIFLYPEDSKDPAKPKGKLRLLYEANPLAFIAEEAGGAASTGSERIMSIQPTELHQRVPLIIGSEENVRDYERFAAGED